MSACGRTIEDAKTFLHEARLTLRFARSLDADIAQAMLNEGRLLHDDLAGCASPGLRAELQTLLAEIGALQ